MPPTQENLIITNILFFISRECDDPLQRTGFVLVTSKLAKNWQVL
jgi:hypothetical protein